LVLARSLREQVELQGATGCDHGKEWVSWSWSTSDRLGFERFPNGGQAYIGDEAWAHLEAEAGAVMARFIEKYVRAPVTEISAFEKAINGDPAKRRIQLLDLGARASAGEIRITLGSHERVIARHEDQSLADDSEDGEED
ncbi:hypothetical protein, partial [Acidovorax sp. SUPP3334]|uniref:hypothetical protein n=1 Tax=Acidovorax sp. SUPP3334 TaxID=2920881 RepID=UPI0024E062CE